jgi:hypothetical protein
VVPRDRFFEKLTTNSIVSRFFDTRQVQSSGAVLEIPKLPPKIAPEDTQKAEKTLGFIWFYESGCGGGGSGFTRPAL